MEIKEIRSKIRQFNKTRNTRIYSELLDLITPNRNKCKECGNEIIYPYTKISCSNEGLIHAFNGCYNTTKTINDKTYELHVCFNCLKKKYPNLKNPARSFNVMSEITKYAFDIPDELYEMSRSRYAMTEDHMIEKYGEIKGKKKWDEYCKRQAETNTFEYKKQKYGWDEKEFKDYNLSRSCTLNNFIRRYGEIEGKKKWDEYCKRQAETKSWDYMVEHFGEEKAKDIIKQRLTGINNSGFSKISQELFRELDKYLCPKYNTFYASKNYEIEKQINNSIYKLDYFIEELNICIEFNGSIFHADPRIFNDSDHPNPFNKSLSAKDIRNWDRIRYETLEKYFGIKTFVVWELDYKNRSINIEEFIEGIIKNHKSK